MPTDDKIDSRKREVLKYEKEQKARDEEMERAQRRMRSGIEDVSRRVREMDRKAKPSGSMGMWLLIMLVGGVGGYVYIHSRKYKCSYAESLKGLAAMALSVIGRVMKERTKKE